MIVRIDVVDRVNQPLTEKELSEIRKSAQNGELKRIIRMDRTNRRTPGFGIDARKSSYDLRLKFPTNSEFALAEFPDENANNESRSV